MNKDEIKHRLESVEIPEPGQDAKERALKLTMAEFNRLPTGTDQKNIKGISMVGRLIGKLLKGGPAMRKPLYISAGLAMGFMALIIVIIPRAGRFGSNLPADMKVESLLRSYSPAKAPQSKLTNHSAPSPVAAMRAGKQSYKDIAAAPMIKGSKRDGFQDQTYVGRDRFENFKPNPVQLVSEAPVSTFSIDVDTASYAFVRKALNRGVLPPKHSVRIEELINYFDYAYPIPGDRNLPFKPTISVFPTPWNPDTKIIHIGIKGLEIVPEKRPKANLVFLIDVSGSMQNQDKLPLLKNAFRMLVETLGSEDTVSIVVYAGAAGTVLEPTKATEKGKILSALDALRAGGSTAGGEGIRRAYDLAVANYDPDGVNRVILATDGDFNVGIRNPEELKGYVERKRKTGIYLSVLGFGQGNYNDALMQKLAQNGNGNAAYIDTLNEARKVLVDEAVSTLFPIANDVKIQVEFNPAEVAEYRLIGYETRQLRREDFNNDRVDAGDVGSGHSVTALYEITLVDSKGKLIDELRYSDDETADKSGTAKRSGEYAFLKIRYKIPGTQASNLITEPIGTAVEYSSFSKVPSEARFGSAVAAFGQLLREDPFIKTFEYDDVIAIANESKGKDEFGYRAEFVNLVRLAKTARSM